MTSEPQVERGSFRDPAGTVYLHRGRVFRTITRCAIEDFEFVERTAVLDQLVERGWLLPFERVEKDVLENYASTAEVVIETPKLAFISYPYEWPFSLLKQAALLHLDIQLFALDYDVSLSDASAYNVQFNQSKLVFIDHLSFRRYKEGEFWTGHRQFCEQFLNPLLLSALVGVPYNAWFRGTLEGIAAPELRRLLPFRAKLSKNVLAHVVLQSLGQGVSRRSEKETLSAAVQDNRLPRTTYRRMLSQLRKWITQLEPKNTARTTWSHYHQLHGYDDGELQRKEQFVTAFVNETKPAMLWDIGCNTGDYSFIALDQGAEFVVGFEFDHGALELAHTRAQADKRAFLPVCLDAANPSPSQGWAEEERRGLAERGPADALFALALIHHLAIGRNVPLNRVVEWLIGLAPSGVLEFVPKDDPKVQEMLLLREDIFADYTEEAFLTHILSLATIVRQETISESGRRLVWYRKD